MVTSKDECALLALHLARADHSHSSLSPRDRARFPPHKQIPFDALYYHIGDTAPYVATLPLDERGYRIPARCHTRG